MADTAAAAASANDESLGDSTGGYDPAVTALIGFLRTEADLSEARAASFRTQADQLAVQFHVTDSVQQRYELDPDQLPPLDENGIPKYKGRKRGRKPKVRKRKSNPARKKRQHTAYTLFVQHSYPAAKAANPGWPSKDVISYVAKQWAVVPVDKKAKWKARAQSTHVDADDEEGKEGVQDVGAMEDDDDEDVEDNNHALEDDEDDNQAPLNLQAAVAAAAAAAVQAGFGQDDAYGMDNVAVAAAATGGTASEEEQDLHDDEDGEEEDDAAPPARRRGRAPRKK